MIQLALAALDDIVLEELGNAQKVRIGGGVQLIVRVKPAQKKRKGRNPATGEPIDIAAKPASVDVRARPLAKAKGALLSSTEGPATTAGVSHRPARFVHDPVRLLSNALGASGAKRPRETRCRRAGADLDECERSRAAPRLPVVIVRRRGTDDFDDSGGQP